VKRKSVFGIMFSLLLISMLTLAFNVQPVKASGTIYIKADGSIDQPTAPISTVDNVTYTFTGNISDEVVVERSNIVIDGNRYTLQGNGTGNGFALSVINVTIKNTNIKGFENGVFIAKHSSHNIVSGNNITNNSDGVYLDGPSSYNTVSENNIINNSRAIFLIYSANNIISGNNVRDNDNGIYLAGTSSKNNVSNNAVTNNTIYGIYLSCSPNNIVSGNNVTNNEYGIRLSSYSPYNTLSENVMNGNKYNFGVEGYGLSHFVHSIDDSNLVNGKPVYYLVNQSDLVINPVNYPQVGYLGLINCTSVTVESLTMTNNGQGLLLVNTNNSRVTDNNMINNDDYGIYLYQSSNNILCRNNVSNSDRGIYLTSSSNDNTISNNNIKINNNGIYLAGAFNNMIHVNNITHNGKGITLGFSINNTIHGNIVKNNSADGIRLYSSSNSNTISGNNVTNNCAGISLSESINNTVFNNNVTNSGSGILLCGSSDNSVIGNNIANNFDGIHMAYDGSINNIVIRNNITNNDYGIKVSGSSNNYIFHNNIVDNSEQVFFHYPSYANVWDDGYPSGGNYWSNHNGVDANFDGIGDVSYTIDANNTDRYPLIAPITVFDAGIWDGISYNIDIISNSTISNFHFNPEEGAFLKFNVTGDNRTKGFCRVTIPRDLLWVEDGWTITVGDQLIEDYRMIPGENFTFLYFTYNHSTEIVVIQGTNVIPEFSPTIVLPLFMMIALIAITLTKKKQKQKTK